MHVCHITDQDERSNRIVQSRGGGLHGRGKHPPQPGSRRSRSHLTFMDVFLGLRRYGNFGPARIRIEAVDRGSDARRVLAEVLLVDLSVVADDKAHHAAFAVAGRPRASKANPSRHQAAAHVIVGSPGAEAP